MTRDAVEDGFERYLSDLVDETYQAFDVAAVLRGSRSGGSRAVSKLLKNSRPLERHVVRPKLRQYQRTILRQFDPVLDYAADTDADFEAYEADVLARDLYWDSLRRDVRGERRETIRERLLERQRTPTPAARASSQRPPWTRGRRRWTSSTNTSGSSRKSEEDPRAAGSEPRRIGPCSRSCVVVSHQNYNERF
jgi:hypothetical protein